MHIKISVITQEDIQREINRDAPKHSPKTVRNNHGLISAVLGLYRPNFAIKNGSPEKVRPDLYIPSDAEVARLMNITRDTEMELRSCWQPSGLCAGRDLCCFCRRYIWKYHTCASKHGSDRNRKLDPKISKILCRRQIHRVSRFRSWKMEGPEWEAG